MVGSAGARGTGLGGGQVKVAPPDPVPSRPSRSALEMAIQGTGSEVVEHRGDVKAGYG